MQGVDESVDGVEGALFDEVAQVGITGGGGGALVTEEGLNMPEAQALFEKMCCEAVTKGVNGNFFLMPHWVTTAFMAA